MSKIATVELFGAGSFSRVLPAWLDDGWGFLQVPPPFRFEAFDPGAARDFELAASSAATLGAFLREMDTLYDAGKGICVGLARGEDNVPVTLKPGGLWEWEVNVNLPDLPIMAGRPRRRKDWNKIVSIVTEPLYRRGIFIDAITLYEDF